MDLIRLGDDTDHRGKVTSASTTMRFDGQFLLPTTVKRAAGE